ncbi:MAG: DnaD domain protein [Anaerolineales bacterium]|nr:DnaD domain protein [Anaerolineales bacterium]
MNKFAGFDSSETFTRLPEAFFHTLLKDIDDLGELKVTLYALWRIEHMEGTLRALSGADFGTDRPQLAGLSDDEISTALDRAAARGTLVRVEKQEAVYYFLNSPRGRAAAQAFSSGDPDATKDASLPPQEHPNVFALYEANIGPLTPMMAESLRDAEQEYPEEWIREAIGLAVQNNKRSWRYTEAILIRWKEEGHGKKQDRRDSKEDRRRYVEGEFADHVEH